MPDSRKRILLRKGPDPLAGPDVPLKKVDVLNDTLLLVVRLLDQETVVLNGVRRVGWLFLGSLARRRDGRGSEEESEAAAAHPLDRITSD